MLNRSNVISGTFRRILRSSLFVNVIMLYISNPIVYGQTISWSGYAAGSSSYTSGPLSAVITNTPGNYYINSSPKYHPNNNSDIHSPNNNCGSVGLLMEMDWGNNANTQNYATTLTINFAQCVYGPITFSIYDINTDNFNSWGDWIDISATGNTGALSAPSVSGCTPNTSVSGATRRIRGGLAASSNTTGCTCGTTNVSVGSSSNKITSITLKYYADPAAWALNPNNPAFQYIIISNLTVGNISCVLPVELISFDGKCKEGKKTIVWSTVSETNNDFYTIEHSKDGIEFSVVADNIKGAGNSNQQLNYEKELNESDNAYKYYRLKQTDFDGTATYSKIILVDCNESVINDYTIINNLSEEGIKVLFKQQSDAYLKYEVYNVLGRLIKAVDYTAGTTDIAMNEHPSGIYLLKITDANNSMDFTSKSFQWINK